MKRSIYILTTCLFLCLIAYLVQGFSAGFRQGFKRGYESLDKELHQAKVNIVPTEPVTTSYQMKTVSVPAPHTWGTALLFLPRVIGIIVAISAFVCFIQLLINLRRHQVFVYKNVVKLRVIAGGLIVFIFMVVLTKYIDYVAAKQVFDIPGYRMAEFSWPFQDGIRLGLLLALFAEIFAYGVKLKEEQEFII